MTELTLESLRAEIAPIHARLDGLQAELTTVCARLDGLPLMSAAIEALRHENRQIRAAINNINRTNITVGEVKALHDDLNQVQTKQTELETRIVTLERLIREGR